MLFSADQLWHVFPFLSFQGAVHQYWWSIRDDAVRRAQGKYRLLTFDFGQLEKLTLLHVSLLKCSQMSWLGTFGLRVIFLRAQPCKKLGDYAN